ncbi:hypothetical protein PspLS_03407 [Pyricularia sp. CBS 133598]|nr:hypothetical protein PspLS_03407 [Pyricularia sp. CBS 133598]
MDGQKLDMGFAIYRSYDDDALWDAFVELLRSSLDQSVASCEQTEIMCPNLEWTVIEDRESLNGVSKDEVRARFLEWVATRSVERDEHGVDGPWVAVRSHRFQYCVYIEEHYNSLHYGDNDWEKWNLVYERPSPDGPKCVSLPASGFPCGKIPGLVALGQVFARIVTEDGTNFKENTGILGWPQFFGARKSKQRVKEHVKSLIKTPEPEHWFVRDDETDGDDLIQTNAGSGKTARAKANSMGTKNHTKCEKIEEEHLSDAVEEEEKE